MPCAQKEGTPTQLLCLSSWLQVKPRIPSQRGKQAVAKGLVCSGSVLIHREPVPSGQPMEERSERSQLPPLQPPPYTRA